MEYMNTPAPAVTMMHNVTLADIETLINKAVYKAFRDAEQRKQPQLPEKIMSVQDAADELRQCAATLHNWRKTGKIRMVKTGGKYGVRKSEVEYIKQYGTRPTK